MENKKHFSLFILSGILVFSFSNFASAFEYGGFGIRPADLENQTFKKDESGFTYQMQPETSKRDGLMVVNNTKSNKKFLLYATDSVQSTDGGYACRQFSEEKKQIGAWIKLEKSELDLKAGETMIVPFDITIPKAIDAGEHSGCFFVQEKKDEVKTANQNGIQLSLRTGVKISVIIPGKLTKKLSIKDFSVIKKLDKDKKEEFNVFRASAINEGNVSVKANVNVKISNSFGITHRKLGGDFVVLRDDTSVWNFQLPKPFWGGFYKAKLYITYDDNVSGLDNKTHIVKLASDKTISFFSAPTGKGLMLELVMLLFVLFCAFLGYIWKQRQNWILTWKSYKVARSTNIKVLAEKYDVNWKLLAKVNRIKAPYIITAKDDLVVPADTEESYTEKVRKESIFTKIKNNFSQEKTKKNSRSKKKKK